MIIRKIPVEVEARTDTLSQTKRQVTRSPTIPAGTGQVKTIITIPVTPVIALRAPEGVEHRVGVRENRHEAGAEVRVATVELVAESPQNTKGRRLRKRDARTRKRTRTDTVVETSYGVVWKGKNKENKDPWIITSSGQVDQTLIRVLTILTMPTM